MGLVEKLFDIIESFGKKGIVLPPQSNLAFYGNIGGIASPPLRNPGDTATPFLERIDDYWSRLNKAEISALILRESLYGGKNKYLRKAIEGDDYDRYLHFVFQSQGEAIDALTSLRRFESQQVIKIKLSGAPEEIMRVLEPILVEQDLHIKKQQIALYLSKYRNPD